MQKELFPSEVYVKYELSFMISPPAHISNYVRKQKKLTRAMVGNFRSVYFPAHISLGKLLTRDDQISKRIDFARRALKGQGAFPIYFNGFDSFPESNTLFVNIANPEPIVQVFQSLFFGTPPVPHMTIAESLSDEQFYRAWKHFHNKLYSDYFICDHILVLGRPLDSMGRWEKMNRILLK